MTNFTSNITVTYNIRTLLVPWTKTAAMGLVFSACTSCCCCCCWSINVNVVAVLPEIVILVLILLLGVVSGDVNAIISASTSDFGNLWTLILVLMSRSTIAVKHTVTILMREKRNFTPQKSGQKAVCTELCWRGVQTVPLRMRWYGSMLICVLRMICITGPVSARYVIIRT
jgi:hypothetical protein